MSGLFRRLARQAHGPAALRVHAPARLPYQAAPEIVPEAPAMAPFPLAPSVNDTLAPDTSERPPVPSARHIDTPTRPAIPFEDEGVFESEPQHAWVASVEDSPSRDRTSPPPQTALLSTPTTAAPRSSPLIKTTPELLTPSRTSARPASSTETISKPHRPHSPLLKTPDQPTIPECFAAPDALLPPTKACREPSPPRAQPEQTTPTSNATDSGPSEVHVHIGRIEVTAVQDSPPAKHPARKGEPPMSLDEYLARRRGEGA